ncbi:MAG: CPBP family glutamic-type intramembrane protease [Thermoguttaceae bacterium]
MGERSSLDSATLGASTDYWFESRQPLTSLVFMAPLLVAYEAGMVVLGPQAMRNGADRWLRDLLALLDFGQYFLLPVLTVAILLGWHHLTRRPWRVKRGVLPGMLAECLLLACCLRLILQLELLVWQAAAGPMTALAGPQPVSQVPSGLAGLIGFLGAGIYEELLFRLVLLSLVAGGLKAAGLPGPTATAAAIGATSLLFAGAHYLGPHGEPVQWVDLSFWFGLSFRLLAGVFFSALFLWRGFGIAAGTHAGYDILVRVL